MVDVLTDLVKLGARPLFVIRSIFGLIALHAKHDLLTNSTIDGSSRPRVASRSEL